MKYGIKLIGIFTILMFITSANAHHDGPYIGGHIGWTNTHDAERDLVGGGVFTLGKKMVSATGPAPFSTTLSKSDQSGLLAGKFYFGYSFNQYFAIEAGYTKFRDADWRLGGLKATHDLDALDLIAKASLPLQYELSLFAAGGVANMISNLHLGGAPAAFAGTVTNASLADSQQRELTFTFVIGGAIDLSKNWQYYVSWQRFVSQGSIQSADLIATGFAYFFG